MKKSFIISIIISLSLLIALASLVLLPHPYNYLIAFVPIIVGTLITDNIDGSK